MLGLPQTMEAFNRGRVWELVYTAGTRFSGYECPRCAGLFPAGIRICSYCGSPLEFVRNMVSRIRQRATERGIKVEVLSGEASEPLSKAGGIGAFLKTTRSAKLGLE